MSISIKNLSKTYGKQLALDQVSFEVNQGEILGFLGPNGAGKTTTMKIICCYMPPDSGTVNLGAYNIHEHPLEVRQRIGYLPEHNPLYLDMYVHEFLEFVAKIYQLPKDIQKRKISEAIELTHLGKEQHKKIGALSKGYRQRVGLAQALLHDPDVLILDEPTSGLDPNQIVDIRQLIRSLGREKTIMFSSHILSEVETIADRVIILHEGKIVADSEQKGIKSLTKAESNIYLEVEKEGFVLDTIQQFEEVQAIRNISATHFNIQTTAPTKVKKAVFELCGTQDNAIMALKNETFSLEKVFQKLTM